MFTLTTLISTLFLSIGVAYNAPKTNNYQHDDNIESPSMCADPSESDISHTNTFHFNDSNINQSGEYKNVGVETFELKYSDEKYENNTIRAAGYLYWKDDSNNNHPIQYVRVELYSTSYSGYADYGYTDSSGHYSLYLLDFFANDLYIKVYCGNSNVAVKNASNNQYVYTSSTYYMVYPGSVAGIGWTVNMSSTIGQAFQVGQAVIMAARYAGEMNGSNLSNVNVSYPNTYGSSNCCYLSSTKTIYLDYVTSSNNAYPNSYASWDAILHEYGHHVQHEFNISNSPGGQHSIGANLADIHGKQSGIRLAWGEAFPTTFSMMVQDYYLVQTQNIYTFGDTSYTAFNGVDEPVENINSQYKSEANEAAIFGLLWDLYDNSSNETFDTISMSHNTFWNIITGSSATTFSAFANCYYSLLTFSERLQFGELLSYYGMAASDLYAYGFDNTPMFNWTRNGTTSTMQNNNFTLMLYNLSGVQLFSKTNINAAQVLLSANEWNQVLSTGYTDLIAVLIAYQTNTPLTGGYISQPLYCDIS